jgi:hypothetical protein
VLQCRRPGRGHTPLLEALDSGASLRFYSEGQSGGAAAAALSHVDGGRVWSVGFVRRAHKEVA